MNTIAISILRGFGDPTWGQLTLSERSQLTQTQLDSNCLGRSARDRLPGAWASLALRTRQEVAAILLFAVGRTLERLVVQQEVYQVLH
jgi:hypothetical protein